MKTYKSLDVEPQWGYAIQIKDSECVLSHALGMYMIFSVEAEAKRYVRMAKDREHLRVVKVAMVTEEYLKQNDIKKA